MVSPGAYEHRQSLQNRLTSLRVVGAIVLTAQLVLVFISFIIRGAVVG